VRIDQIEVEGFAQSRDRTDRRNKQKKSAKRPKNLWQIPKSGVTYGKDWPQTEQRGLAAQAAVPWHRRDYLNIRQGGEVPDPFKHEATVQRQSWVRKNHRKYEHAQLVRRLYRRTLGSRLFSAVPFNHDVPLEVCTYDQFEAAAERPDRPSLSSRQSSELELAGTSSGPAKNIRQRRS
jgi:hypothetical protein